MWRVLRFLAGLVLLPAGAAVAHALWRVVLYLPLRPEAFSPDAAWLIGGFVVWLLFYGLLPRPTRAYVMGHELTHALWGWLMGARVSKLRVGEDSGSVTLSKTNFLVTLAPYFFPFYTMLLLAVFGALALFYPVERYHLWWMGMVGLTWGFHFTFTVSTLLQRQSDVQACGRLFSYAVIILLNLFGIGLWVVAVSPVTLGQWHAALADGGVAVARGLAALWDGARTFLQ
jgi:hypothetical protein